MDDLAQAILQCVGGGEEETAVEPDDGDAGNHLIAGMLSGFTEDLRARFAAKGRHLRVGGHPDEPDERESDPNDDAGEHAEDEGADDRCDRNPEVESLHPGQPSHLGTFIMPMTTASMISAASTGLGRLEKSGARKSSVSRTVAPE